MTSTKPRRTRPTKTQQLHRCQRLLKQETAFANTLVALAHSIVLSHRKATSGPRAKESLRTLARLATRLVGPKGPKGITFMDTWPDEDPTP